MNEYNNREFIKLPVCFWTILFSIKECDLNVKRTTNYFKTEILDEILRKKTLQHSAYYTCHSVMADSECFYVYVLGAVNNFFLSFNTPADRDSYLNTGYMDYLNTHSIMVCLNLPRFSTYKNKNRHNLLFKLLFKQGNVFEHF